MIVSDKIIGSPDSLEKLNSKEAKRKELFNGTKKKLFKSDFIPGL